MSEEKNTSHIFSSVSFIILGVLLCCTPLFIFPSPLVQFQYSKAIFISVLVALALIATYISVIKRGTFLIPREWFLYAAGAVVLTTTLSAFFTPMPWVSLIGQGFETSTAVFLFLMFLVMYIVAVEFQAPRRILLAHVAFLGVALVLGLFHVSRFFFGEHFLSFGVFTELTANTIGSWNEVGIFFGATALISVIMLQSLRLRSLFQVLVYAVLVLSVVVLMVVNFNLIWYVLGLLALGVCVYFWPKISYPALGLCAIAVLFANPLTGNVMARTVGHVVSVSYIDVRPSWSATYDVGVDSLSNHPFLGAGPNHFSGEWELHRPDINASNFWNASFIAGIGFVPTAFVETGLLGLLSWLALLVFFAIFVVKVVRVRSMTSNTNTFLLLASSGAALYFWALNVLYVTSGPVLLSAFFFTGLALAAAHMVGLTSYRTIVIGERPRVSFLISIGCIALVLVAVLSAFTIIQKTRGAAAFRQATIGFASGNDVPAAEKLLAQAIDLDPSDVYYRAQAELELAKLNATVSGVKAQADVTDEIRAKVQKNLENALAAAQHAVERSPTNFSNKLVLAHVYGTMLPIGIPHAYESAVKAYEETTQLSPQNPALFLERAQLEIANSDPKKAREYLLTALKLKENYAEAIFLLSQLDISDGNIVSAIASVQKIAALTPQDPAIFFRLGLLYYDQKDFVSAAGALGRAVELASNYANAKYFLGLSYYNIGRAKDAIVQFEDLSKANPDNTEVAFILNNLKAGRAPFASVKPPLDNKPEKRSKLPVKEKI